MATVTLTLTLTLTLMRRQGHVRAFFFLTPVCEPKPQKCVGNVVTKLKLNLAALPLFLPSACRPPPNRPYHRSA